MKKLAILTALISFAAAPAAMAFSKPPSDPGSSSGGATDVPAPSMILLFGAAAAGLAFRRSRKLGQQD